MPVDSVTPRWHLWLGLGLSLLGLNLTLSFHNLWPTPWVTTRHELSVEIAALALLLAAFGEIRPLPSPRLLRWLALLLVLFAIGRYLEVTAPALYGRRINLYWDAQHLPRVAAMLVSVLPVWQVWLLGGGVLALLTFLYLLSRGMLTLLVVALTEARLRRFTIALSASLVLLYAAGYLHPQLKTLQWFSLPVSMTYAKQFGFLYDAMAGDTTLDTAAEPLPQSGFDRLAGADVLILFFESYGATTLDRPELKLALAAQRKALAEAIEGSGRRVVSARVRSPTFGGASWLAHSTFLSGIEVTENHRYQLLLTQQRDTLVHRFAGQGYRTVGLMPGLRQAWPEGAFYGYDRIYDASSLDYPGPAFGWWRIPDQYALARFDAIELAPETRRPLMAVVNSISSHAPFRPVPPYQADWQALLGPAPYAAHSVRVGKDEHLGWSKMGDDYVAAVNYVLTYVAGYLKYRAPDDLVLIILGDHQPPTRVSGPNASWDVPVHVVARNAALIEALRAEGFVTGLEPQQVAIGPMRDLAARLLRAFGGQTTAGSADTPPGQSPARSSPDLLQSRVDVTGPGVRR